MTSRTLPRIRRAKPIPIAALLFALLAAPAHAADPGTSPAASGPGSAPSREAVQPAPARPDSAAGPDSDSGNSGPTAPFRRSSPGSATPLGPDTTSRFPNPPVTVPQAAVPQAAPLSARPALPDQQQRIDQSMRQLQGSIAQSNALRQNRFGVTPLVNPVPRIGPQRGGVMP